MGKRPKPPPPPEGFEPGDAVSISQLGLFLDCETKWHFAYQQDMREPDTEATALGQEVHDHMEAYLTTAQIPAGTDKASKLARALIAMPQCPEPGTATCEDHFYYVTPRGNLLHGYTDVRTPGGVTGLRTNVKDWKTSSNLGYMKNLAKDPQALVYAVALNAYELEWLYVLTKGDRAGKTATTGPWRVPPNLEESAAFKQLDADVSRLRQSRKLPVHQLEANTDHCNAYGKTCHVKHLCPAHNKTAQERPKMANFAAFMKSTKKPEAPAAAAPAVETPAEAQKANDAVFDAPAQAAVDKLRAEGLRPGPIDPIPEKVDAPTLPQEELPAPEPKAKRTRAPKEKTPAESAAVAAPTNAPGVALHVGALPTTLYIGCHPLDGAGTPIERLYLRAHALVEEQTGAVHYSAIEYGKGAAAFVAAFKVAAEALPVELVVDPRASEWSLVSSFVREQFERTILGGV